MTNPRRLLAFLLAVGLVVACDATYRIVFVNVPHCPASDSAKRRADSIPVMCLFPDTSPVTPSDTP